MTHQINIHNYSNHDQEFECHSGKDWIQKNVVVHAQSALSLPARDGSSGAIIAVHEGHEGEQVEFTKSGFGGNDFIDLSNIVGAGGNMIVQQEGKPETRKGDPRFMQDLNNAWHKTNQGTRDGLKNCVHLDNKGNVKRIDAIKDFPKLEAFVRSFANGMTYIGVGAWGGSPGNDHDNKQSSAGQGSRNLLVIYNDGDATPRTQPKNPPPKPGPGVKRLAVHGTVPSGDTPEDFVQLSINDPEVINREDGPEPAADAKPAENGAPAPAPAADIKSVLLHAQADPGPQIKLAAAQPSGTGITIINHHPHPQQFAFYNNYWNGNGTAGANFDHPAPVVTVPANGRQFVSLPASFKGRVQRGTLLPSTWVEFQLKASNDGAAHGDISLQQGCDGAAIIKATDGSGRQNGFSKDILTHAPEAAVQKKSNGVKALASTMGNWMGGPNQAAIKWEQEQVGQKKAYIVGGTGTDDVASKNGRFEVEFFAN
ncbi:MAG: hypothetical protein Q9160_004745 [Pyrenula sp. 1 TL-2023]